MVQSRCMCTTAHSYVQHIFHEYNSTEGYFNMLQRMCMIPMEIRGINTSRATPYRVVLQDPWVFYRVCAWVQQYFHEHNIYFMNTTVYSWAPLIFHECTSTFMSTTFLSWVQQYINEYKISFMSTTVHSSVQQSGFPETFNNVEIPT